MSRRCQHTSRHRFRNLLAPSYIPVIFLPLARTHIRYTMQRSSIASLARRRCLGSPSNTLRGHGTPTPSSTAYRTPAISHQSKTCHQQPRLRAFHSSGDFADYMKQVMSPMTGHVGEQTPSEESNTLREIDRLFTIISSKQQSATTRHSQID